MTRRGLLASAVAVAGCGRKRGSGFPGFAFVANGEGNAVAAVDLTTFAVARHIRLASSPRAVIAHPRKPLVYALTPESGELHEIDVTTLRVSRTVRVARTAPAMRLQGDAVWVAASDPRRLVRVPLDAFRAEGGIPLPAKPVDFDFAPDGATAAVTFGEAGSLALVDLTKRSSRLCAPGRNLGRVLFRSDGRALMTGDSDARSVLMLEPQGGRTIVDLPLAVRPDNFCVKSDGGQLFVTGPGMDGVVFVYPYSTEVSETVLAGKSPGAMAECVDPDANLLLIANPEASEVSVMEIETRRVIAVVAVGRQPGWIGMTPDQQYALVLNRASGDMAVIRVAALAARRSKSAPLFTLIPVGSGPVSLAVRQV